MIEVLIAIIILIIVMLMQMCGSHPVAISGSSDAGSMNDFIFELKPKLKHTYFYKVYSTEPFDISKDVELITDTGMNYVPAHIAIFTGHVDFRKIMKGGIVIVPRKLHRDVVHVGSAKIGGKVYNAYKFS